MLKPEEIKKRIHDSRKSEEWIDARLGGIKKLNGATRSIGQRALGLDDKGPKLTGLTEFQFRNRVLANFKELDEAQLTELAKALFPRTGDVVQAALALQELLPYQVGYSRKAYRAPGNKDLILVQKRELLADLVTVFRGLDEDLPWIAAHAAYLEPQWFGASNGVGSLLAAALDVGTATAKQVDSILRESAAGTHEIGTMGRHITNAFLCAKNPDGWRFVEGMLLAAQRQEGFRQSILESIDIALPDAFRHMLKVIIDNNLVRFSSTVRAADVWLSLRFDSQSARYIGDTLETLSRLLNDESAREHALQSDAAEQAFLALWCTAFEDANASLAPAAKILAHASPEMRLVGLHHLSLLGLNETYPHIAAAVDDPDFGIACYATAIAGQILYGRVRQVEVQPNQGEADEPSYSQFLQSNKLRCPAKDAGGIFDRLVRLFERLPAKPKETVPLVWPWMRFSASKSTAADTLPLALEGRSPSALLPYLDEMSPDQREWTALQLGYQSLLDTPSRDALLRLVGDASPSVRERAVKMMKRAKIQASDLAAIEPLLSRKASDLRRGVINLILSLEDAAVAESAARLTGSKTAPERLAGLELLSRMREARRYPSRVLELATGYRETRKTLDREEQGYLDKLLEAEVKTYTLEDALGLMDPTKRTQPSLPVDRSARLVTPAAIELLKMFDALVHEHREAEVKTKPQFGESQEMVLGAVTHFQHQFSPFEYHPPDRKLVLRPRQDLPLHEVWFGAYDGRPKAARDLDGLELARAAIAGALCLEFNANVFKKYGGSHFEGIVKQLPALRYLDHVRGLISWLIAHTRMAGAADFAVDSFETVIAGLPIDKLAECTSQGFQQKPAFRDVLERFLHVTSPLEDLAKAAGEWTEAHERRIFGLRRWVDEPVVADTTKTKRGAKLDASVTLKRVPDVPRQRMDWKQLVEGFEAGLANENDLYDDLLGVRPPQKTTPGHFVHGPHVGFSSLDQNSRQLHTGGLPPRVDAVVRRAIERVLEIELARGESETIASPIAQVLRYAGGRDVLVRILCAIGRDPKLQRTYTSAAASQGKLALFSHLIRVTMPGKEDSLEAFAADVKAEKIGENVLLAVAFYAPQWARHVQEAIGWPMFAEAIWWFHAHTKDTQWQVEMHVRESWNAEIRKLTPLELSDLMEGAVDVDWFHRTFEALGPKRWERLDEFAKYASGGLGHKRAQLFAQAMLGQVDKRGLMDEVDAKRKQDAIRALGLLPLEPKAPKQDLLARFKAMQEFVRTSRQFGSMRQAAEKLAARIAQENLARTAGYPDPIRLQWAMEALATADLAAGPVSATVKDVTVSLAIDDEGLPEITVTRGEKLLKSPPPAIKKNEAVAELFERKTDLRRSASRMRGSLEQAMCRGDVFNGEDLVELMGNVILKPMLERLVFIGEGIAGYLVGGGKALGDCAGKVEPIKKTEKLRLAHPVDLLASKNWTSWQRECFASERTQPFKQVFRELYVLTSQEKSDATFSQRYAGHQVNPRQAMALLGSRGWVTAPEQGIFRTFHDEKLVAWLEFLETFYTPAEVEGLTLEKVRFAHRGATEYARLTDVPPRVFSEVMRDVDLAVSVAHRGAIDPEASASTVELRASLLRETLQLLKLKNVTIKSPHILIKGTMAEYSVHLGSGTTHMLPGGTLFIVPVHSQHRGRIFLPFADDDPKTAEITSKVLLLARDSEIKDPSLRDQIRAAMG
jgi:hypothetical protein